MSVWIYSVNTCFIFYEWSICLNEHCCRPAIIQWSVWISKLFLTDCSLTYSMLGVLHTFIVLGHPCITPASMAVRSAVSRRPFAWGDVAIKWRELRSHHAFVTLALSIVWLCGDPLLDLSVCIFLLGSIRVDWSRYMQLCGLRPPAVITSPGFHSEQVHRVELRGWYAVGGHSPI